MIQEETLIYKDVVSLIQLNKSCVQLIFSEKHKKSSTIVLFSC